ncbi:DHA2 family efflux MFS transporter permease subunit [Xenorhabdus griffiniae]|uniref:DHA2 family efflux MFS transporter permease subunit n=1 Tax=Xenorhabdus griffiniae TaxID=351672 RepID=UPI0030CC5A39
MSATGQANTLSIEGNHKENSEISFRSWCAVIGGLLGGFMAIMDIQITNSSMKVIQGALSATLDDSSWLMTSYFTAEIIAIPLCGWLTQALGSNRYALWCIVSFLAASILCSFSWNLNSMIVFRALQGFSGGALIPLSFRLIIEVLPGEKRPFGMSLFGIVSTFSPAIGPSLGGWLTETFSWHAIFYINAVPAVFACSLINYGMKRPPIRWLVILDGDFIGILTAMLWLGSLEVVLEEGRSLHWLDSNLICSLIAISVVAFLGFIYDQLVHPSPLINIRMFRDAAFSHACIMFFMLGIAIYGTLFMASFYLTTVHNYDALQIGNVLIWMGLPQLAILPFIPKLLKIFNLKYMIFIGFTCLAISSFMNGHMDSNFAGQKMKFSLLIWALGQPFIMVPLSMIATRNVQSKDSASSAILINITRSVGGSMGTAILSTLYVNHAWMHAKQIQSMITSDSDAFNRYVDSVKALLIHHGGSLNNLNVQQTAYAILIKDIKLQAQIIAFNDIFYVMGGMMLATAIMALLATKNFRLFQSSQEK